MGTVRSVMPLERLSAALSEDDFLAETVLKVMQQSQSVKRGRRIMVEE